MVKKISEQEAVAKTLKDKQKSSASLQVDGKKQMKIWKDLLRQMEMKHKQNIVRKTKKSKISNLYFL